MQSRPAPVSPLRLIAPLLALAAGLLAPFWLAAAPARAQTTTPFRTPQWDARYRLSETSAGSWFDVAVDKRTGCAVVVGAGARLGSGSPTLLHIAKYSPSGRLLWNVSDVPATTQRTFVALDDTGGIYVAGTAIAAGSGGGLSYVTGKWNAAGKRVWLAFQSDATNSITNTNSVTGIGVAPSGSGGVYVTGVLKGATTSSPEFVTVRYNAQTGGVDWTHRYDGPSGRSGLLASVAVDAARGAVYVAGETMDANGLKDFVTLKLNAATGAALWERHYSRLPGVTNETLVGVKADPLTGAAYVAGTEYNASIGGADFVVVKYNPSGTILWTSAYNGVNGGLDLLNGFAVEAATGAVALTGASDSEPVEGFIYSDMATVKFSPSGVRAWVARYNGPENGDDAGARVAFDPQTGDVLAAGGTLLEYDGMSGIETYGLAVARYAGTNGTPRWVGRYQSENQNGSFLRDTILGMATDAGGSLLIAGYGPSRFHGDDGGEKWLLRYNTGAYAPVGLSVGGDSKTRLLWSRSSDAAPTVWRVGATGTVEAGKTFASSGYAPVSIAADPSPTGDVTRLLLARPEGAAVVWNLAPNFASVTKGAAFGPLADATGAWDAAGLAQGGDGIARLLWHHRKPANSFPDKTAVWNLNGTTLAVATAREFGPVAGYEAAPAFSVGPGDNKPRLVWSTGGTENKTAVWTVQPALAGTIAGATFGPVGGGAWSCIGQATGGDGKTRLLWLDSDRSQFAVWTLNAAGAAVESSGLFGPVAGYAVAGIACGPTIGDSRPRLLLMSLTEGGRAAVWTLNAGGTAIEKGETFTAR